MNDEFSDEKRNPEMNMMMWTHVRTFAEELGDNDLINDSLHVIGIFLESLCETLIGLIVLSWNNNSYIKDDLVGFT